jgi:hypothetical protein
MHSIKIKLVCLAAMITSPAHGHVLMPMSYEQMQAEAHIIVIAETVPPGARKSEDIIEFNVLSTLKGQKKRKISVTRWSPIEETRLTCCAAAGRYIMFLRQSRKGLYHSVHGNLGIVRLAE